ncbi:MAG: phosphate ABC transporter ATP-binding protein PstB [Actinomycetota bacterium]|nr:phosphate ABC transporter ATP-binding protein PstB [Actinomycetota bacterium]
MVARYGRAIAMTDPRRFQDRGLLVEETRPVADTTAAPRLAPVVRETVPPEGEVVFDLDRLSVFYGTFRAVRDVSLAIRKGQITALIGPSGCGKTTLLRSLNRMHDLTHGVRVEGRLRYHGNDLYGPDVDAVVVRRLIGMVFQRPNPFPKSIYDNVAFGPRIAKLSVTLDDCVEEALRKAALWDEVKDRLKTSATQLSGGQQQRLCIARAIAAQPEVILMDEPCSALDPVATLRIEDLMQDLKADYTIVIVTHNMQQAARVSDMTAFFTAEVDAKADRRAGVLVEFDRTEKIFTSPSDERTEAYVSGRFG